MTVQCLKCKAKLAIPEDQAARPGLKLRCPGCGLIFPLAKAPRVDAAPARHGAGPPPVRPAGASPATPPRPPQPPGGGAPQPPGGGAPQPPGGGAPRPPAGPSWRHCSEHPQTRSDRVCPSCARGYCGKCGKRVQSAVLCPACETLTRPALEWEKQQARAERAARPLHQEIPAILAYPFTDPTAFVILAILVWVFGFVYRSVATAFLMASTLQALTRVADGHYSFSMPEFSDPGDLWRPVRLGLAVFLICYGPMLLVGLWTGSSLGLFSLEQEGTPGPAVAHAQEADGSAPDTQDDSSSPGDRGAIPLPGLDEPPPGPAAREEEYGSPWSGVRLTGLAALALLTFAWRVFYAPAALMVAAYSRSFLQTLKPWVGLDAIRRMGTLYAPVLGLYSLLSLAQWLLGIPLAWVPIAGALAGGFVQVYASLAGGCLLGLAVARKAEELGVD